LALGCSSFTYLHPVAELRNTSLFPARLSIVRNVNIPSSLDLAFGVANFAVTLYPVKSPFLILVIAAPPMAEFYSL